LHHYFENTSNVAKTLAAISECYARATQPMTFVTRKLAETARFNRSVAAHIERTTATLPKPVACLTFRIETQEQGEKR
jgi:hypothetical protein